MQLKNARRVIALGLALAMVAVAFAVSSQSGSTYTVTAHFPRTPGLYEGNDVVVLGVSVGKITAIEPHGDEVEVRLEIREDVELPRNVSAVLVPQSIVTDRVIELTPSHGEGPALAEGDEIPIERTRVPVEFEEIIAAVDNLAGELGRMEEGSGVIDRFMHVAARNAKGNGRRLRDTLLGLQSAMAAVSSNSGDTVALIDGLADLTEVMADNDATIRSFSEAITTATTALDADGEQIAPAMQQLLDALRAGAGLLTDNRDRLHDGIAGLADAAGTLRGRTTEIAEIIDVLPLLMQNIERAVDTDRDMVRARVAVLDSVLDGGMIGEFCELFVQLPICDAVDPSRIGADLGLTELLTGSIAWPTD